MHTVISDFFSFGNFGRLNFWEVKFWLKHNFSCNILEMNLSFAPTGYFMKLITKILGFFLNNNCKIRYCTK